VSALFGPLPRRTRLALYAALGLAAAAMLYPFLYMFSSALKADSEVFGALDLLPMQPEQITLNGQAFDLYFAPAVAGDLRLVRVGSAPSLGIFADPARPLEEVSVPLDQAQIAEGSAQIGGGSYPYYTVSLPDGRTARLALLRRERVGRFAPPEDMAAVRLLPERSVNRAWRLAPHWENFSAVLRLQNIGQALLNTLFVTALVTAGQLFTSATAGYVFARLRFAGRQALFTLYLATIMVPFVVIIIPLYQMMNGLGWLNTLSVLIVPWWFTAYGTFFMRQFFLSIPKELEDAAIVDGATRLGVLWRVCLPLARAPLGTLATFTFLYGWNSFLWPLLAISSANKQDQVLTLALNTLRGQVDQSPGQVMAAATLSMLPAMVVFILAQRYFVEGIQSSGLGGR
jgi:multiple sugar transport system permease protein